MTAEPHLDAVVGTVLEGAYRITRLIGEGGMAAVYEAVQLRLNKRVAVKVMARELAANREALARFHREAEITSHLGHPHLVSLIDFGTAESGEPYIVMEHLSGEDLEHRVGRVGRLSIANAVHITRQIASALAAAHGEGIVHRDLKPANVFLLQPPGEPDFVKVLDFGISKVKAAGTKLTQTSTLIGTPQYMSPEQATGRIDEIDHRTDQWSLACIVWEMLSGRAPFVADDLATLLYQIINLDPQSMVTRVPNLPPEAQRVLRRALSKKLTDRYPSITDFSRTFEAAATGRGTEATSPPTAVPHAASTKETIAYGSSTVAHLPPSPIHPDEINRGTGKQPTTLSQAMGELPHSAADRRLKPAFAIAAGGAATGALLLATLLLFRSGSTHKPTPTPTSAAPAVTAPVPPPGQAQFDAKPPEEIADHGDFTVKYEPTKKKKLRKIAEVVEGADAIFESLMQVLNAQFALAKDLPTVFRECESEENAFYNRDDDKVTICYEFVQYLDRVFPNARLTDALVFFLFHELGHALVEIDRLPSKGGYEVAADQFATYALLEMVEHGSDTAVGAVTIIDTDDSLDDEGHEHLLGKRRADNVMCWVYGADPNNERLRKAARRDGLPESRLDQCNVEYESMKDSWSKLLQPHLKRTVATSPAAP